MRTRLVAYLGTRVTNEIRSAFVKKAKKIDGADPSDVLRELVAAFVEDRITVTPKTIELKIGETK